MVGKKTTSPRTRRTITTNSLNEVLKQEPITDMYKRVVDYEKSEAKKKTAGKDALIFKKICHNIRQLLADISVLKSKRTNEVEGKIAAKRIEASLLIAALKKLNRLEKFRTREGRETLNKEKQRVDSTHLLLQNLLYEADHLNKEVKKCLQFKSKDEEIELVPLDEFYKEAPEDIARPHLTKSDSHQLQLARLEWELHQRRELVGACNDQVDSKEHVAAAIAAARSRLDALSPHLRDVLMATKPLQEILALRLDEKRDEARAAASLPSPLFLLYANASAYSDILGTAVVSVGISGDEDEAKRLDQTDTMNSELVVSNDSDSDQDNDDEQSVKKKRHHRMTKISKEEKAEAKRKLVLMKHPLSVLVTVKIPDGDAINLIYSYLLHLKIVVVKCTMSLLNPITGVSAADVLNGDSVLNELYPKDNGNDSPHPATTYLFNVAGVNEEFRYFIPELGRAYIWAQKMCGLDFMAFLDKNQKFKQPVQPCQSLSVVSVENFIFTLRKRLSSRLELMGELQELENGRILPVKQRGTYKCLGSFTQWQSIGWEEYCQAPSTSFLVSESLVTPDNIFYRAIITRQSAKLVALVAISSNHPKIAPLFSLTLHWNGTHHSGTNDDIRDIERIINTDFGLDDIKSNMLSAQMTKLLICLDIVLETMESSEFPPDKIIIQSVRGRNRAKPYKFLNRGIGMFVHY